MPVGTKDPIKYLKDNNGSGDYKEALNPDCEHVLPILAAYWYIGGLYTASGSSGCVPDVKQLEGEYKWSHHYCNHLKLDALYINDDGTINDAIIINELQTIWDHLPPVKNYFKAVHPTWTRQNMYLQLASIKTVLNDPALQENIRRFSGPERKLEALGSYTNIIYYLNCIASGVIGTNKDIQRIVAKALAFTEKIPELTPEQRAIGSKIVEAPEPLDVSDTQNVITQLNELIFKDHAQNVTVDGTDYTMVQTVSNSISCKPSGSTDTYVSLFDMINIYNTNDNAFSRTLKPYGGDTKFKFKGPSVLGLKSLLVETAATRDTLLELKGIFFSALSAIGQGYGLSFPNEPVHISNITTDNLMIWLCQLLNEMFLFYGNKLTPIINAKYSVVSKKDKENVLKEQIVLETYNELYKKLKEYSFQFLSDDKKKESYNDVVNPIYTFLVKKIETIELPTTKRTLKNESGDTLPPPPGWHATMNKDQNKIIYHTAGLVTDVHPDVSELVNGANVLLSISQESAAGPGKKKGVVDKLSQPREKRQSMLRRPSIGKQTTTPKPKGRRTRDGKSMMDSDPLYGNTNGGRKPKKRLKTNKKKSRRVKKGKQTRRK